MTNVMTLGEVATYINGRAFKPSEWEEAGLPIIRIQNLTESNKKYNYSSTMNNISDNELYLFFWSIIMEVCEHKFMKQTSNIEALSQVLHAWISGKTFYEIYLLASSLNLCYNSRNRNVAYKIEDIIDLCENCFAYEVVFLLGSIIDFANFSNFNTERIELFQKRVKYGLPNTLMINLFELGFSDRVVTSEIAHCITIQKPSKRNLKDLLIEYKDQVFSILKRYPRFFKKQFEDMIK